MFAATNSPWAPWHIAHSDDKKRARLNVISHLLDIVPYKPLSRKKTSLPKRHVRTESERRDDPLAVEIPTRF
jgi:hypothetical protein